MKKMSRNFRKISKKKTSELESMELSDAKIFLQIFGQRDKILKSCLHFKEENVQYYIFLKDNLPHSFQAISMINSIRKNSENIYSDQTTEISRIILSKLLEFTEKYSSYLQLWSKQIEEGIGKMKSIPREKIQGISEKLTHEVSVDKIIDQYQDLKNLQTEFDKNQLEILHNLKVIVSHKDDVLFILDGLNSLENDLGTFSKKMKSEIDSEFSKIIGLFIEDTRSEIFELCCTEKLTLPETLTLKGFHEQFVDLRKRVENSLIPEIEEIIETIYSKVYIFEDLEKYE